MWRRLEPCCSRVSAAERVLDRSRDAAFECVAAAVPGAAGSLAGVEDRARFRQGSLETGFLARVAGAVFGCEPVGAELFVVRRAEGVRDRADDLAARGLRLLLRSAVLLDTGAEAGVAGAVLGGEAARPELLVLSLAGRDSRGRRAGVGERGDGGGKRRQNDEREHRRSFHRRSI